MGREFLLRSLTSRWARHLASAESSSTENYRPPADCFPRSASRQSKRCFYTCGDFCGEICGSLDQIPGFPREVCSLGRIFERGDVDSNVVVSAFARRLGQPRCETDVCRSI